MPVQRLAISIVIMPTEREYESANPEIKPDHRPTTRLRFLDRVPGVGPRSLVYSVIIHVLAIIGIVYLLS